jgi:hypothetical protein
MNKFSRTVDIEKMNQSKQRTMEHVMEHINTVPSKKFRLKSFMRPVLLPAFVLIFALVVVLLPKGASPIDERVILSEMASEKAAEIAYISSSFIGLESASLSGNYQFLDTSTNTEFENDSAKINLYFDTLRLFLEEDFVQDTISVTVLENDDFEQLLKFTIEDQVYQFYITINEDSIEGELHIGTKIFSVSGTYKQTDDELSITLRSIRGTDSISIEYKSETNQEVETKFQIKSRINGVEETKEIKVSIEDNESKVEIKEGENEYLLKKELEDGSVQYKLEYKLNGVQGNATITETTNNDGNTTYNYRIKEGNVEKDISAEKPDHGYENDSKKDKGNSKT